MASLFGPLSTRAIFAAQTAGTWLRWASTLEWTTVGDAPLDTAAQDGFVDALTAFYRSTLLVPFFVERVDVSTAAADGQPYAPETFLSRSVMLRGQRGASEAATIDDVLPITNCLLVKKVVNAGREGSMLLRGCLREVDVKSDPLTGAIDLTDRITLMGQISNAWSALVTATASWVAPALVRVYPDNTFETRPVVGVLLKGVTSKKLNNKYFDRRSGSVAAEVNTLAHEYPIAELTQIVAGLIADGATAP